MTSVQPTGVASMTDTLERVFGDLPLYEAESQLHLIPNSSDRKGAERLDPWKCVLSKCCKRLFGSTAVAFFGYYAYVDRVWRGTRVLERFTVPKSTRDAIDEYDRTKVFPVGGFILYPPAPTQKLEYRRQQSAERRERLRKKAELTASSGKRPAATRYVDPGRRNPSKLTAVIRRNGHGLVRTHAR